MLDLASVEAAFEQVGALDHLVITAAGGFPAGLFKASEEDVRGLFDSKFWGQYRCARAALPNIRAGGSITFTSGIRSRRPGPGTGAFTAVNNAVEGMTKGLALEIEPIRVNCLSPGVIDTPLFDGLPPERKAAHMENAAKLSTVGRHGTPEDCAGVVLTLMTSGFVSGVVIDVDGGALLK
jgi:NAD(P)-dependent dehydrogenase (short-subunit alcohol dehydrogenase family)